MPSKGTPPRAIRLDDDLWSRAKDLAQVYGRTPSDVVRVALDRLLDNPDLPLDWQPVDRAVR